MIQQKEERSFIALCYIVRMRQPFLSVRFCFPLLLSFAFRFDPLVGASTRALCSRVPLKSSFSVCVYRLHCNVVVACALPRV